MLIAAIRDDFSNLLAYFGRHGIHNDVSIALAPSDPLLALLADSEKLGIRQGPAVMLRIVDFETAMHSRAPANGDDMELTLRVIDDSAPWNKGTWRVGTTGGETFAGQTASQPETTLTACCLAPLSNGYLSPQIAAQSGLIDAESDGTLDRAARLFATSRPPHFTDSFCRARPRQITSRPAARSI